MPANGGPKHGKFIVLHTGRACVRARASGGVGGWVGGGGEGDPTHIHTPASAHTCPAPQPFFAPTLRVYLLGAKPGHSRPLLSRATVGMTSTRSAPWTGATAVRTWGWLRLPEGPTDRSGAWPVWRGHIVFVLLVWGAGRRQGGVQLALRLQGSHGANGMTADAS